MNDKTERKQYLLKRGEMPLTAEQKLKFEQHFKHIFADTQKSEPVKVHFYPTKVS